MSFAELIDLASVRVGGRVLLANDEFFAEKENLLKPEAPVFLPHEYTDRGKWMDGWETRRRRSPGFDWSVIKLGLRGVIRGVDVDTSFFTGNYPEHCSIDACDAPGSSKAEDLVKDPALWTEILPKTALKGNAPNQLGVKSLRPWTHLRLNIFPDGGVARLRAYGDVVPDWERVAAGGKPVDLAAVENAGVAVASSDMHYGKPNNMLMPGRAKNMGDGWETKRRRGPGHDWTIVKLGATGMLSKVEVDTNHFKGNYPDAFSLEGCLTPEVPAATLSSSDIGWTEILSRTKLSAHKRHSFAIDSTGPFSHVRLNIYPDGGVSRLRLWGHLDRRA